ncbi:MAG UNVERIFIED_CONTAM: hypothetical protein LVR18_15500 [Planctomycetaceae bacterium]
MSAVFVCAERLCDEFSYCGVQAEPRVGGLQLQHYLRVTFFVLKVVLPERQAGGDCVAGIRHG